MGPRKPKKENRMKLALPETKIESSKEFVDQSFAIGDLAVIMEILRGKMYSNPIRTIVQEISSNARDAHREVNRRVVPIHIKLPSRMDMNFSVRDFGPGITPDRMANIFLRYGCSTKRSSDFQTGGFGLGAKSPFAYSDTFCIESVTPGRGPGLDDYKLTKRTYTAFIDESRIGKISLMSCDPTDEPQGTKITVACKPGDENAFLEHVLDICRHWPGAGDPKPDVTGKADFEWPDPPQNLFEGEGWYMALPSQDRYGYSGTGDVKAIVDGIPYPIKEKNLGGLGDMERLFSKKLNITFKTGELALTANREELDYQPSTIQTVRNRLRKIYDALGETFNEKLSGCKDFWEANSLWRKTKLEFAGLIKNAEWRKHVVTGERAVVGTFAWARVYTTQSDGRITTTSNGDFQYADDVVPVLDDMDHARPSRGRVERILNDNPGKKVMVLSYKTEDQIRRGQSVGYADRLVEEAEKYKTEFGKIHKPELWGATKLSEVEPIKHKRTVMANMADGSRKPMLKVRKYIKTDSLAYNRLWEEGPEDVTVEDGEGLYVILSDKSAYFDHEATNLVDSSSGLAALQGFVDEPIYGIQKRYVSKIGDGWTPLLDAAQRKFDREIANGVADGDSVVYTFDKKIEYAMQTQLKKCADKDADLNEWIVASAEFQKEVLKSNKLNLSLVAQYIGQGPKFDQAKRSNRLMELSDKVMRKMPLLEFVRYYGYNSAKEKNAFDKAISDYVEAVNKG